MPLRMETTEYRARPEPDMLPRLLTQQFGPPHLDPRDGDFVAFWVDRPDLQIHCGIIVDDGEGFVHVERDGQVRRDPLEPYRERVVGFFGIR